MPRYLHIPHTPDTARTLTLSGRNCLVVSDIVTPPKIGYRRRKGRRLPEDMHSPITRCQARCDTLFI